MTRMTGGQALAKQLYREGVRVIFGVPGIQLYGALAAIRDEPGIRYITARHEQATTFMADGYARAGGGEGVALVVPGPGLLNASSGLHTAYSTSSPVLLVSGQVERERIGGDFGALHEVNDQLDGVRALTKWQRRVLEPADIPAAVHEAFRHMRTGRPRPVEIEIPPEALLEVDEIDLLEPSPMIRPAAPAGDIDRAAEILATAERPVIYAGSGVHLSGAHDELRQVAELLQAPVIASPEGKGALGDRHSLSLGAALAASGPVREVYDECDVILAVGTRFALGAPGRGQRVIQIDIDPDEIGRHYAAAEGLAGDAKATLRELAKRLAAGGSPRASRVAEMEEVRRRLKAPELRTEPQEAILSSMMKGMPDDTIVVSGMTQVGYYSRVFLPVYGPRAYFTSSYSGNLGFAYPVALGAKVALPERPVLALCGDGGFMYNSQEMATAVMHGINVVAVVFNDGAFGNVLRDLEADHGGQIGARLHNPDFVKLAEAYGALGLIANEPADLGARVAEAFEADRPALIEVPVGGMSIPKMWARSSRIQPRQRE